MSKAARKSVLQRPAVKLEDYPKPGTGGIDLALFKGGRAAFQSNIKQLLQRYPNLGKSTSGGKLTDKVVLVGDQGVGKTSLVLRYCENSFQENYKATIGVDFCWQRFILQGIGYTVHIWDTAGQEKFNSLLKALPGALCLPPPSSAWGKLAASHCLHSAYYRGAKACIVVFDLGDPDSMTHCSKVTNPHG
ncbi:hypothetical protein CYMTET_18470 [Cymbomonas tetramitiformis]|uniref:Uncharacterized protein n=1 Tax=Cymbomonas tetramitiformis TaxID=36881 RepID=A0AAE0G8B8_9CHLO|nr:hypothetical protein CYMTET_18470 [Cymbomonas tetramitiformis]